MDNRPICRCSAYKFPHRIGGKCKAEDFLESQIYGNKEYCESCGCFNQGCEVLQGRESLANSECYKAQRHYNPAGYLPLFSKLDES